MKSPRNTIPARTLVSLFSGIGGLDDGLHAAGFAPVFCCEIDIHARASLENWARLRGVAPRVECDVTEIDPHGLRESLGLASGELDLLAGGPPCQAFSLIGKRRSLGDPRGALVFQMVRFAEAFLPRAVLIEQVKGFRSAPGRNGHRGGALRALIRDLEGLGYCVHEELLRASNHGVAQHRDRVFVVGVRDGEEFVFPSPSHRDPAVAGELPVHRTVRDVLVGLPAPGGKENRPTFANHVDVTPSRDRERIHGVPEGEFLARQLHLPKDQRQRLNPKKDTTKFRRLAWDAPSLTLRGGEAFYHPTEDRYITPREAMRIHGFPDGHVLEGPIRGRTGTVRHLDQHRQVANSVPPPLAQALGQAIQSCLRG